jgi:ABC-type transport system substrate-binding protein
VPSIPLYYPVYTYFVSDEVKGIQLGTLFGVSSRFRDAYKWSLEGSGGGKP